MEQKLALLTTTPNNPYVFPILLWALLDKVDSLLGQVGSVSRGMETLRKKQKEMPEIKPQ